MRGNTAGGRAGVRCGGDCQVRPPTQPAPPVRSQQRPQCSRAAGQGRVTSLPVRRARSDAQQILEVWHYYLYFYLFCDKDETKGCHWPAVQCDEQLVTGSTHIAPPGLQHSRAQQAVELAGKQGLSIVIIPYIYPLCSILKFTQNYKWTR